eukprot:TRINITY_DN38396_c0_g1_i1.p2 TRINITY_DN38396_c0_g1~~TRINITY_DN38396_c0_g1_i1.p2  ORF type:complete len:477 (+),score=104.97 TRINITY_DN38396_c0_g1_i1:122-1552(+)
MSFNVLLLALLLDSGRQALGIMVEKFGAQDGILRASATLGRSSSAAAREVSLQQGKLLFICEKAAPKAKVKVQTVGMGDFLVEKGSEQKQEELPLLSLASLSSGRVRGLKVRTVVAKDLALKRREARRANAQRIMAAWAKLLSPTILGEVSVKAQTISDYTRRLEDFWGFIEESNQEIAGIEDHVGCDRAMANFFIHLWGHGEAHYEGELTKSAFEFANPRYARGGDLGLPMSRQALRGWRLKTPSQPTPAIPEEGACAVAGWMHAQGLSDQRLYVLAGFSTYMRPSENSGLAIGDILPPVRQTDARADSPVGMWTILLRPFEKEVLTKTKGFDEAISLDDARMTFLGPALGRVAARRLAHFKSRGMSTQEAMLQRLWSFSQAEVLASFQQAGRALGIEFVTKTLYVLRHGGVSRDIGLKLRSLPEAQRTGNWAVPSSLKHYEKHGRLQWFLHRIGRNVRAQGEDFLRSCKRVFLN